MRISDWSADVCSSVLAGQRADYLEIATRCDSTTSRVGSLTPAFSSRPSWGWFITTRRPYERATKPLQPDRRAVDSHPLSGRSEEHTSELQSLMRNSYAVFCLKKKKIQ